MPDFHLLKLLLHRPEPGLAAPLAGHRYASAQLPPEVPVTPLDLAYVPRRIDNKSRADLREFFYQDFLKAGILHPGKVGEARSWYVPAQDFYIRLEYLAERGITIYAEPAELAAFQG